MADPELFILFCEDARVERGNTNSLIGVYGPSIGLDPLPPTLRNLKAVTVIRCGDLPEVDVRIEISSEEGPENTTFPPFEANVKRDVDDTNPEWQLTLIADLDGLPTREGMKILVRAFANKAEAKASLLIHTEIKKSKPLMTIREGHDVKSVNYPEQI